MNHTPLFTQSQLDDYILKWAESNTDERTEENKNKRMILHDKEVSFLKKTTCSKSSLHQYRKLIENINSDTLSNMIINNFYNYQAMIVISCVIASLFYDQRGDIILPHERIRHWINNLTQIQANVQNEIDNSFTASFGHSSTPPIFLIKTPRHQESDLVHEAFIGLYGTNRLRLDIPNFAFIFGTFACSPPIIKPLNPVISWCSNDILLSKVDYVIYENITPSIYLEQYLIECTGDQFLNIYVQILYALDFANQTINFTHFDLTYKNVILRYNPSNSSKIYIPYKPNVYILTDYIPTITNYETSYIKYEDTDYPSSFKIDWTKSSFPIYDAHLLLTSSLYWMHKNNNFQCYNYIVSLLDFFVVFTNNQDQQSYIYNQHFTKLPINLNEVSIMKLIEYINGKYQFTWRVHEPSKNYPILSCKLGRCLSSQQAETEIMKSEPLKINDIFELTDVLSNTQYDEKIITPTLVNNILSESIQRCTRLLQDLSNIIIKPVSIFDLEINEYEQYIMSVNTISTNFEQMITLYEYILFNINYFIKIKHLVIIDVNVLSQLRELSQLYRSKYEQIEDRIVRENDKIKNDYQALQRMSPLVPNYKQFTELFKKSLIN